MYSSVRMRVLTREPHPELVPWRPEESIEPPYLEGFFSCCQWHTKGVGAAVGAALAVAFGVFEVSLERGCYDMDS